MRRGKSGIAFAALDFVVCVALWALIQLAPPPKQTSAVRTFGVYAVVLTWPGDRHDDLDLYVQDPHGHTVWFASRDAGVMHLEHDDLGNGFSGYAQGQPNFERVVIRAVDPGEYVVDVHVYSRHDTAPVPATVELWRIAGQDKRLVMERLVMRQTGDEQTAFRFSVRPDDGVYGVNRLPKSLVG